MIHEDLLACLARQTVCGAVDVERVRGLREEERGQKRERQRGGGLTLSIWYLP